MRIVLLGASGMFGTDALPIFLAAGHEVRPGDLPDVDITDRASLARFLDAAPADVVLNAAAYTNVDGAESQRQEAFRINAQGARLVAEACQERKLLLVHVSTDYVFPGDKASGYLPDDPPGPAINAYGQSKLEGERAIQKILREGQFLVCRTQWLYGNHGKNFPDTILKLSEIRNDLRVVNDQWGVPTYTVDLANQMVALLGLGARGFSHTVGGGGPITWYDFAAEILRQAGSSCRLTACTSEEFPRAAVRPEFGWLRSIKVPAGSIRHWREALAEYLRARASAQAVEAQG